MNAGRHPLLCTFAAAAGACYCDGSPVAYDTPPARAGIPNRGEPSQLTAPPASDGLPPANRRKSAPDRKRARHPAVIKGRTKADQVEGIVAAAKMVLEQGVKPERAAVKFGVDATGISVKAAIKSARASLAAAAEEYVALHLQAARAAAEDGDARPAQWALENIHAEGERIIDPPKTAPTQQPVGVRIGITMGGIPQQAGQTVEAVDVKSLPALVAAAAIEDTP